MAPSTPKRSLAESAKDTLKHNPSALGDPISMKAETADSEPTEHDRPNTSGRASSSSDSSASAANSGSSASAITAAGPGQSSHEQKGSQQDGKSGQNSGQGEGSLKDLAQKKLDQGNASQLGDPVSLKAETADSEPTEKDRPVTGEGKRSGSKL